MSPPSPSLRRLGKESLIYGLGTLLSRAASFIMLPIYTRALSPADYGVLQVLDMSIDVIGILVSAGATAGVMRFYFATEDAAKREAVLTTAWLMNILLNLAGSLLLVAAAGPVWRSLLDSRGDISIVYLAAANFSLNAVSTVPMLKAQMDGRAGLFSLLSIGRLLLQLSLNILFLVGLRLGPKGILLSVFISATIIGVASTIWMFRQIRFRLDRDFAGALYRFGVPYQITTAGSFVLTFGDRFFLERYVGLGELGIYGLAYQFGFILASLTFTPYLRAWNPQRHQIARDTPATRDAVLNRAAIFYSLLTIAGAVGIALFVGPLLTVMSSVEFRAAAVLVPVVVLAYTLQSWSDSFIFHMDVSGRTSYLSIATWASVVAVLVFYAVLIPRFGAMGAAWATVLAFLIRLGLLMHFGLRAFPVHYRYGPHLRLLGAAIVAYLAFAAIGATGLLAQIGAAGAAYLVFLGLAWLCLPAEERAMLRSAARGSGGLVTRLLGSTA